MMATNNFQLPSFSPLISPWNIAVLLTVLGGFWALLIFLQHASRVNKRSDHGLRLPPGPRGFPLLGNLLMLGDLPHRSLYKFAQKYGPIMYIKLGLVPTVVVSSSKAAELFLKTHDINFASRPYTMGTHYMSYGNKGVAFSQHGTYWRNMRRLCTTELLSVAKVQSFKQMRKEEMDLLVGSLREAGEAGVVVDMSVKVRSLIENVTFRMLIGSKVHDLDLKSSVEEFFKLVGAFNLSDFIPYIGALDLQGLARRMKEASKVLDRILEEIIDDHVNHPKDNQKDFIDVMLSLMMEPKQMYIGEEENSYMLDRTNIKAIILDMILGGIETSSVTIEWILSELLKHPKVMKKLQEELKSKVGMDRLLEEENLVELDYLDMVVKETVRLHPALPLLLAHESLKDITIDGFHIPKKSRVIINAWAIQRNPDMWSTYADAEKFLPERFKGSNVDIKGHAFELIPFGSGRRGCPGMYLGLTVVKLVVGQLIHVFNWELPNGMSPEDLDMSEKFGLSVPRANHLLAVPSYRLCLCGSKL